MRGPVLALFCFDGGLRALDPETWTEETIPVRIGAGVLIGLAVLLFWGSVVWAVSKLFRSKWQWSRVVISFPLIFITWLGLAGQSVSRHERNPDEPGIFASQHPENDSSNSDEAELHAFSDWFRAYASTFPERIQAARTFTAWSNMDNTVTPSARERLAGAARLAGEHQRAVRRLEPTGEDEVEAATMLLEEAAGDLRTCIRMTQRLMKTLDVGRINQRANRADRHCQHSDRTLRSSVKKAETVFNQLGGSDTMPGLSDEVGDLVRGS